MTKLDTSNSELKYEDITKFIEQVTNKKPPKYLNNLLSKYIGSYDSFRYISSNISIVKDIYHLDAMYKQEDKARGKSVKRRTSKIIDRLIKRDQFVKMLKGN